LYHSFEFPGGRRPPGEYGASLQPLYHGTTIKSRVADGFLSAEKLGNFRGTQQRPQGREKLEEILKSWLPNAPLAGTILLYARHGRDGLWSRWRKEDPWKRSQ